MKTGRPIASSSALALLLGIVALLLLSVQATAAQVRTLKAGDPEYRAIASVVKGVVAALNKRDARALSRYYRRDPEAVFYGMPTAPVSRGTEAHLKVQGECLQMFKEVSVKPNDDMRIRSTGNLATVKLTGVNENALLDGRPTRSEWFWTIELQKVGTRWLISQEHVDFHSVE